MRCMPTLWKLVPLLAAVRTSSVPSSRCGANRWPFYTNGDAKSCTSNGEIDAVVADLPTAFAVVANELRDGLMVGQLPTAADDVEQFGIVLDKGSALTRCVSSAVDALRADGALAALQDRWLAEAGKAPVLG